MIENIFTEDPEISEKPHHQEEFQIIPQITRRDRHSNNQTPTDQGSTSSPAKKRKKKPSPTEERAQKRTSLTRSLPAPSKVDQGALLRQFQDDLVHGNGEMKVLKFTASEEKDLSMEMLNIFQGVSEGLLVGSNLGPLKDEFVKLFSSLDEKNALCEAMLLLYEKQRLFPLLMARAHITSNLIKCAEREDLTPAEELAFFKIFGDEVTSIRESLKEFSAAQLKDVEALLEKIDSNDAGNLRDLAKQFEGTTPQGREIIRRVLYKLKEELEKQSNNETEPEMVAGQEPADQNQGSGKQEEEPLPTEPTPTDTAIPECPPSIYPYQGTENIENRRPVRTF